MNDSTDSLSEQPLSEMSVDERVETHLRPSRDTILLQELLPNKNGSTQGARKTISERNTTSTSLAFRCYIMISMTFIWTGYTIVVRLTRSTIEPTKLYSSTTVVLMSEVVKLIISLFCLFRMKHFDLSEFRKCISEQFIGKPLDLIKMSVPSIAYAIQNNLDFIALSNLDAGTYQVTTQLKVVTTAIFMMLILGRRFSLRRWIAITLLFIGVASVQMNAVEMHRDAAIPTADNYALGLTAVLLTCVTAGFAGVYFEMMLKDGTSIPLWIRNLQMYSCGVVSASIACYLGEFDAIISHGFFHGYNSKVCAIIAFLSVGGIYISLVMKYLDNLYKSFASAVSIILVVMISLFLFDNIHIGFYFIVGSVIVCAAILIYNSVDE